MVNTKYLSRRNKKLDKSSKVNKKLTQTYYADVVENKHGL